MAEVWSDRMLPGDWDGIVHAEVIGPDLGPDAVQEWRCQRCKEPHEFDGRWLGDVLLSASIRGETLNLTLPRPARRVTG
jgi:hypothetical protein